MEKTISLEERVAYLNQKATEELLRFCNENGETTDMCGLYLEIKKRTIGLADVFEHMEEYLEDGVDLTLTMSVLETLIEAYVMKLTSEVYRSKYESKESK